MSKKLFAILIIVLAPLIMYGQSVKVVSNEGVELLNTVWVLANGAADTATSREVSERFGAFTEHEAVRMLRLRGSTSAIHYIRNFEHVILPCTGLKIEIGAGGKIDFDLGEPDEGNTLYQYWKREMMESFLSALGDFYRHADFKAHYTEISREAETMNYLFMRANGSIERVQMERVNDIMGSDIKEVLFIAPITRLSRDYSVPFVFVDGELLPMFYDADSELQHPSHFAPFNILSPYNNDPLLGLLTALYAREEHAQGRWDSCTPGFIHAVFEILESHCKECDVQGFQAWNFMSKWMPMLLADEYCKDDERDRARYIRRADRYGFIWHRDALDFMQYYYQNREKYHSLRDFMPQIKAYVASLPEQFGRMEADYDAACQPYIVSVYPAPNTILEMSGDSIEIEIRFSQEIMDGSRATVSLHTLYERCAGEDAYTCTQRDGRTLMFRIGTEAARATGFYGIRLTSVFHDNRYEYLNPSTRDFDITYFQPK